METWANLNVLVRAEAPYISPEERQRLERVAVGRICRCGDCICCQEMADWIAEQVKRKPARLVADN